MHKQCDHILIVDLLLWPEHVNIGVKIDLTIILKIATHVSIDFSKVKCIAIAWEHQNGNVIIVPLIQAIATIIIDTLVVTQLLLLASEHSNFWKCNNKAYVHVCGTVMHMGIKTIK